MYLPESATRLTTLETPIAIQVHLLGESAPTPGDYPLLTSSRIFDVDSMVHASISGALLHPPHRTLGAWRPEVVWIPKSSPSSDCGSRSRCTACSLAVDVAAAIAANWHHFPSQGVSEPSAFSFLGIVGTVKSVLRSAPT